LTFKEKLLNCGKGAVVEAYCTIEQLILNAVDDWEAKKLIEKAYSKRRDTRILARAKLKRFYPDVWEVIHGSEEN